MKDILEGSTVAIQKEGRLTADSLAWLNENTGSDFPEVRDAFDQTRELYDFETDITVLGFSNGYISDAIEIGVADFGIGGSDKYYERLLAARSQKEILNIKRVADLGFAACDLVVAKPVAKPECRIDRVLTTYPAITEKFFNNIYDYKPVWPDDPRLYWMLEPVATVQVDRFPGSTETVARKLGYDALVDIRQSGESLRLNGWTDVAGVMQCQAVLLGKGRELALEIPLLEPSQLAIDLDRLQIAG